MPYAIDQEKLDSPNLKVLDIAQPPMKSIPHIEYPKMVYLHPKDKSKEHRTKVVNSREEEESALASGYRKQAHVPAVPVEAIDETEFDIAPEPKRK